MTDDPTNNNPDQPSQPANEPTPAPPPTPPSEPSGVGFAAIDGPGQQAPAQPPPPPSPSAPVYQYDYSRTPNSGGGAPVLLIAVLGFVLVLVVGVGAMLALGIGPFAKPTPAPTLVAQPTPTARPETPAPTATSAQTTPAPTTAAPSPSGSAGPTATPIASGDVKDALLSHIPEAIRDTCFVSVPGGNSTIVALATCSADDGNIALTYFQYDSYDSMFLPYEGFRMASQIEPGTGNCSDHDSWPAEDGFNISGQLAGRWLCTEALGATSIYWTDNRLNIMSQATQAVPDYERFVNFWLHESGPDL
ncbi:MAG: hypothetical protein ABI744_06535 [Chloroflexota bacterium]